MPYSAAHAAATRARIVNAARRLFNRIGFEQVTIAQIMAEAGLTRGGFYHHFDGKEALFVEAVASYAQCNPFRLRAANDANFPTEPRAMARLMIDMYLSDEVFIDTDQHCPLYALPSESARSGKATREAYTGLIKSMMQVYRMALAHLPDGEQRARNIVSLCVGGMVLARTTEDAELQRDLRASARTHALTLLDG